MLTLPERLSAASESGRGVTFIAGDDADHVSYADLHAQARQWIGNRHVRRIPGQPFGQWQGHHHIVGQCAGIQVYAAVQAKTGPGTFYRHGAAKLKVAAG